MKEYVVHYKDKNTGKYSTFYFLDYKDFNMLLRDLSGLDFENEYGEILDIEKTFIQDREETPAYSA